MSLASRVVWSEGLFLKPHHFQQEARYYDRCISSVLSGFPHAWGFQTLIIDTDSLELGQISVQSAKGFMPDGTILEAPNHDMLPVPVQVDKESHGLRVFLCLPPRRQDAREASASGVDTRRLIQTKSVPDLSTEQRQKNADITVAPLRPILKIEKKPDVGIDGFVSIAIAKISDIASDGAVKLDPTFIPSVFVTAGEANLSGFISHTEGLLNGRALTLADRVSGNSPSGAAEVSDYILLQTINRYLTEFRQFAASRKVHPLDLYRTAAGLCSELAVHTQPERIVMEFPAYDHRNLTTSFQPVMAEVRRSLSFIGDPTATKLPLVERKFGIKVATVADATLFTHAQLVLSVGASMSGEDIRRRFPREAKIGGLDVISDLVNIQLPGVRLNSLPQAPRQVPFQSDKVYFQLERKGDYWSAIVESRALALHVGGDFPDIELTLWAIREARG